MEVKMETGIPIPKPKYYDDLIRMVRNKNSFIFPESDYRKLRQTLLEVKKRFSSRRFKTISISETERRIWRIR